jgi:serine/threonine-protein kinase
MGEVYRADDLTLGQSVALKFLPAEISQDAERRRRLLAEVRVARQISHANVCRVYDIGELEGRTFLTMEFIDGEDLSSLLRRIGRLPQEKAIEIARQLCAGLAALHDRGVVHRDLKPANIMIDGRGRVRITDFGLAGNAEEFAAHEVRAGTPAYMAPEQLSGTRVDAKSDLYSLGLILYEVFTGKRAFEANSVAELGRMQQSGTPTGVSQWVPDIDPAVERVISRCLEHDAARRPPSALAVVAALPGGDPLAEALAAGEVPSMELVAAAGKRGGIRPIWGAACVLAVVVALLISAWVGQRTRVHAFDPMSKPPVVLADRAHEILDSVGVDTLRRGSASGFRARRDVILWIRDEDSSLERWTRLAQPHLRGTAYWYRQSPQPLVPRSLQGQVSAVDPAPIVPGMVYLELDTRGRLLSLEVVPPERDAAVEGVEADWASLLQAAGFDEAELSPAEPARIPRAYGDRRAAWTTPLADADGEIRIEAAALGGQPVFFTVVGPWTRDEDDVASDGETVGARVVQVFILLSIVAVLFVGIYLAIRHIRLGRGDRKGAQRFSLWLMISMLLVWTLTASHPGSLNDEINLFLTGSAWALFSSALLFAFYLAVEPFVRKTWPQHIVSWSRVLTGRMRDPLVGRDILLGGVFFAAWTLIDGIRVLPPWVLGKPVASLGVIQWQPLFGPGQAFSGVLACAVNGVFYGVFLVLAMLMLRFLCRGQRAMLVVFCAIFGVLFYSGAEEGYRVLNAIQGVLLAAAWLTAVFRFGLLAFLVGNFLHQLVLMFPITLDTSQWYAGTGFVAVATALALAGYGLSVALAGKSLFRDEVLDDSR